MSWVEITTFIKEYYPVAIAGVVAVAGFVGTVYVVWTQVKSIVQPILDKIQDFRDRDEAVAVDKSLVDSIKFDVLKTDLMAKIANPTISPELTLLYQTQLDRLSGITTKATDTIDKVEEATKDYIG